jgi:hypothetical protein
MKFLALRVAGIGESLHGVGREHQQRICFERCSSSVAARKACGIAIDFG